MTLLVIGATGTLGRQIVKKSLENGFKVKCLVRNKIKAYFLKQLGAELVYGDLSMPETLPICLKEVSSIIDASTTRENEIDNLEEIDLNGKLKLIDLAKKLKIKRFIFFSILNAEKYPNVRFMNMKIKIEEYLKESKIKYTVFKVAGFYQALINQYAIPILDKQPVWTTKEFIPIGYIDTQDAASICLKSLFLKTTENETFFLLGPETWFSNTIIQICEKFSGQKAKIKVIPILSLKFARKLSSFFEWSKKINERLAFVEVIEQQKDFSINSLKLYNTFDLKDTDFIYLENYLKEYFEKILNTLQDLNYEPKFKNNDLLI